MLEQERNEMMISSLRENTIATNNLCRFYIHILIIRILILRMFLPLFQLDFTIPYLLFPDFPHAAIISIVFSNCI